MDLKEQLLQMPLYQSHKKVRALKITDVVVVISVHRVKKADGEQDVGSVGLGSAFNYTGIPNRADSRFSTSREIVEDEEKNVNARIAAAMAELAKVSPDNEFNYEFKTEKHCTIYFEEGIEPVKNLPLEFLKEKRVEIGGYLVQYDSGYLSYSPAKDFEDGYTKLPEASLHFGQHTTLRLYEIMRVINERTMAVRMGDQGVVVWVNFKETSPAKPDAGDFLLYSDNSGFYGWATKDSVKEATRVPPWEDFPSEVQAAAVGSLKALGADFDTSIFRILDVAQSFGNTFVTLDVPGKPVVYVPPKIMASLKLEEQDLVQIREGNVVGVVRDGMVYNPIERIAPTNN